MDLVIEPPQDTHTNIQATPWYRGRYELNRSQAMPSFKSPSLISICKTRSYSLHELCSWRGIMVVKNTPTTGIHISCTLSKWLQQRLFTYVCVPHAFKWHNMKIPIQVILDASGWLSQTISNCWSRTIRERSGLRHVINRALSFDLADVVFANIDHQVLKPTSCFRPPSSSSACAM